MEHEQCSPKTPSTNSDMRRPYPALGHSAESLQPGFDRECSSRVLGVVSLSLWTFVGVPLDEQVDEPHVH